jgi:uncharacterized protein (DUF488 family)
MAPVPIFTIGHSNHPAGEFVALLARHGVTAVADVRSSPFSRYAPQYNREGLAGLQAESLIAYVFLGDQLGARPRNRDLYVDGRVVYERLASSPDFQLGIGRLEAGMSKLRLAVMCSEKDPLDCHRGILVARELRARGVGVSHIGADGSLEPHDAALSRLLAIHHLPEEDLFRRRDELVTEAYARQEHRIAFVDPATRPVAAGWAD